MSAVERSRASSRFRLDSESHDNTTGQSREPGTPVLCNVKLLLSKETGGFRKSEMTSSPPSVLKSTENIQNIV